MAASTNGDLTTDAAPFEHFESTSKGSQVWVSVSTTESGLDFVSNAYFVARDADLCIIWNRQTGTFQQGDNADDCDDEDEGWPRDEKLALPLRIRYHYKATDADGPLPVFLPDAPDIDEEDEALVLGFRPELYRGSVRGLRGRSFSTPWKRIRYTRAAEDCEPRDRPEFVDLSPFDGIPFP